MTEMFGEVWPPMSVPDMAPDDDDLVSRVRERYLQTCHSGLGQNQYE